MLKAVRSLHSIEYTPLRTTQHMPANFKMVERQILAANLRAARVAARLSQEDLTDSAGIGRTYVSALKRSRYSATVDVLQKLADALGVEAWTLLQQR